ncbi:hypothetical protein PTSG_11307 [Salpingoeca rosetta]|uniref:Uncharacterized protein n=1 Tax=Salpingoeca rosetta (strain ATCC 50818 / BSB-021) TaxID=946362 RepID=F2UT11_SALR5|nr:uncharacterized protein PTSG_11307 [Salpingoeca rosetta]EGD81270.1 hypothetical protein PTSG_11307 [Salpingoeca rosetta]|eukprot:XP_004987666.1 hypothetical protein PTSG_11307 [Salpingoeca rosetta]
MTTMIQAVAAGSVRMVREQMEQGADINSAGSEGLMPLCVAAFWGHLPLVEMMLENGADVNVQNPSNKWTPLHAAAIQGHGKVVFALMDHNPDTTLVDANGCTAADYASALDNVWPHFAAAGHTRTPKPELIKKGIIFKVPKKTHDHVMAASHLNRPGSAYAVRQRPLYGRDTSHGDVLAEEDEGDGGQHRSSVPEILRS